MTYFACRDHFGDSHPLGQNVAFCEKPSLLGTAKTQPALWLCGLDRAEGRFSVTVERADYAVELAVVDGQHYRKVQL